jgi:hypothetical protein
MVESFEDRALAEAYMRQHETNDRELFWAFEKVVEICRASPERGWQLTLALIAKASNPDSLSYVAAGPLEDLLTKHGSAVIDRVEIAARRDPKFRLALGDVWGLSGDIYERVKKAVGSGSNYQWGSSL